VAAEDDFYKNPADGRPLVARPRTGKPSKAIQPSEVAFAQRSARDLRAKGYSPEQIARGLCAAMGRTVTPEMVEGWLGP
jgi:hypothetical protein